MNIVLIGYRGVGKSVVGDILGRRLNMTCVSVDEQIVQKAGMPIAEIVEKYGWSRFRDLESEMVRQLAGENNLIMDTGGGIIERPENMVVLKNMNATIIWLKASVDTIVARIRIDNQRPSLTAGKSFIEEVDEVLKNRIPKYKSAAQFQIDTDNLTPDQVANKVIEILPIQAPK